MPVHPVITSVRHRHEHESERVSWVEDYAFSSLVHACKLTGEAGKDRARKERGETDVLMWGESREIREGPWERVR